MSAECVTDAMAKAARLRFEADEADDVVDWYAVVGAALSAADAVRDGAEQPVAYRMQIDGQYFVAGSRETLLRNLEACQLIADIEPLYAAPQVAEPVAVRDGSASGTVAMLEAYKDVPCTWGRSHDKDEIAAAIAALRQQKEGS